MPHSAALKHVLLCLPKDQIRGYYSIQMVTFTIVFTFLEKKMGKVIAFAFCGLWFSSMVNVSTLSDTALCTLLFLSTEEGVCGGVQGRGGAV